MPVFPVHTQLLLGISVHIHRKLVLMAHTHPILSFSVLNRLTLALSAILWPQRVQIRAFFYPVARFHPPVSLQHLPLTFPSADSRFRSLITASIMSIIYLCPLKLLPASYLRPIGLKFLSSIRETSVCMDLRRPSRVCTPSKAIGQQI